jgi:hypothetical protein
MARRQVDDQLRPRRQHRLDIVLRLAARIANQPALCVGVEVGDLTGGRVRAGRRRNRRSEIRALDVGAFDLTGQRQRRRADGRVRECHRHGVGSPG